VILYVESSAVLSWLLGERAGTQVRGYLAAAELVLTSSVTIAESERALVRLVSAGTLPEHAGAELRAVLELAAQHWMLLDPIGAVLERVGTPFPVEPVRTLDAIHLASALEFRSADQRLHLLSLDRRVRANAARLGFRLLPNGTPIP
jgi:predicted nucleic acid-binding protein